eukprot:snap_masked-scaffold_11-processed-gene-10.24-mRNA-1 protein AED:1.00 eAED:1.00 QI:0/0/0/0/1/1/2/0/1495
MLSSLQALAPTTPPPAAKTTNNALKPMKTKNPDSFSLPSPALPSNSQSQDTSEQVSRSIDSFADFPSLPISQSSESKLFLFRHFSTYFNNTICGPTVKKSQPKGSGRIEKKFIQAQVKVNFVRSKKPFKRWHDVSALTTQPTEDYMDACGTEEDDADEKLMDVESLSPVSSESAQSPSWQCYIDFSDLEQNILDLDASIEPLPFPVPTTPMKSQQQPRFPHFNQTEAPSNCNLDNKKPTAGSVPSSAQIQHVRPKTSPIKPNSTEILGHDSDSDSDIAWDEDDEAPAPAPVPERVPDKDLLVVSEEFDIEFPSRRYQQMRLRIPVEKVVLPGLIGELNLDLFSDDVSTTSVSEKQALKTGKEVSGKDLQEFNIDDHRPRLNCAAQESTFPSLVKQHMSTQHHSSLANHLGHHGTVAHLAVNPIGRLQDTSISSGAQSGYSRDSTVLSNIKRRKTKEEKVQAKEARLDRLRNMGLLPPKNVQQSEALKNPVEEVEPEKQREELSNIKLGVFKVSAGEWPRAASVRVIPSVVNGEVSKQNEENILNRKNFTGKSGSLSLIEYMEEKLPLSLHPGMNTKLRKDQVVNELFSANVVPAAQENRKLWVLGKSKRRKAGEEVSEIYLKKVEGTYFAGQSFTQGKTRALNPTVLSSKQKELAQFLETYILYFLVRKQSRLTKVSTSSKLTFSDARQLFPKHFINDLFLRRYYQEIIHSNLPLKEQLDLSRKLRSDLEDSLATLCAYTSGQNYFKYLHSKGIFLNNTFKSDLRRLETTAALYFEVEQAVQSVNSQLAMLNNSPTPSGESGKGKGIRAVLNTISSAPWNQTALNLNHLDHRNLPTLETDQVLPLIDLGPRPAFEENRKVVINSGVFHKKGVGSGNAGPGAGGADGAQGYGGTDYDLRKISLEESEKLLMAFGIQRQVIQQLDRWDRILVIENKASMKEGSQILNEKFKHFARSLPSVSTENKRKQTETIKQTEERLKKLRSQQIPSLLEEKPKEKTHEEDPEDDFLRELEEEMEAKDDTVGKEKIPSGVNAVRRKLVRRVLIQKIGSGPTERLIKRVEFVRDSKLVDKVLHQEKQRARARLARLKEDGSMVGVKRKRLTEKGAGHDSGLYHEKKKKENKRKFEWYKAMVTEHGKGWPYTVELGDLPDFMNQSKLSTEIPKGGKPGRGKKGKASRCKQCHLPGHKTNSLNCPLRFAKVKGDIRRDVRKLGSTKLTFKKPLGISLTKPGLPTVPSATTLSVASQGGASDDPKKKVGKLRLNLGLVKNKRRNPGRDKLRVIKKELGNILCSIIDELIHLPGSVPFVQKVPRKLYPNYYDIIKKPMWLELIRSKCNTGEYMSSLLFINDLQNLLDNSVKFNGIDSEYTKAADSLFKRAQELLQQKQVEISRLETILRGGKEKKYDLPAASPMVSTVATPALSTAGISVAGSPPVTAASPMTSVVSANAFSQAGVENLEFDQPESPNQDMEEGEVEEGLDNYEIIEEGSEDEMSEEEII